MRSTFFGLSSALTGITNHQRALDTTNHNVDNVNTEGYTRQRVNLAAAIPFSNPAWNTEVAAGQLGQGVTAASVTRMRDQFIDNQLRSQASIFGEFDQRANALQRLNQVIDEPGDAGITKALNNFWGAWQTVSTSKGSAASREAARAAGESLARAFTDTRAQLVATQNEATLRIGAMTTEINSWVGQINTLNQEIFKVQAIGQTPNDLMDQRDVLIDQIAATGNLAVTTAANGKVSISYGGQVLLDGTSNTAYPVSVTAGGVVNVGAAAATLTGGALKGMVDIRGTVVGGPTGYLANLDNIAATVIDEVNNIHSAGFGLDGSTGNNFFSGTNASNIAVDAGIMATLDTIAASATAAGIPGDGTNAMRIAQLLNTPFTINGATTTINGSWGAWVAKLGTDTDQAARLREVQKGVLGVAESRRDSVGGVNLDEEMADMVRFQKSYNAAARMITTIDSMLETIVTRMGLVGR